MTLGILGGMGPAASVDFARRLVEARDARRDQDHPRFVLDCDPSVPDRTEWLLRDGPQPLKALVLMTARLIAAGCDQMVVACNTAAVLTPSLRFLFPNVDWVDWVEIACQAVADGYPEVTLLATDGTVAHGLYQARLSELGVTCNLPSDQVRVMAAIRAVKAGRPATALDFLAGLDLTGPTLVACTELSLLGRGEVHDGVDAAQAVAEHLGGLP